MTFNLSRGDLEDLHHDPEDIPDYPRAPWVENIRDAANTKRDNA